MKRNQKKILLYLVDDSPAEVDMMKKILCFFEKERNCNAKRECFV